MKTRLLLTMVIALLMVISSAVFVVAGDGRAVQETVLNGVVIGVLEAWTPGYGPFVVAGENLSLVYHDGANLVRDYQGVQFWIGGVYHPLSFYDLNFVGEKYVGVNTLPSEGNCGLKMVNAGVRPITTGKML